MTDRPVRALGLMSGTSADGITAALVSIGGPGRFTILGHRTFPFAARERERIHALSDAPTRTLSEANVWLGERFAAAARRIIRRHRVDVIGSHGQTVWHEPGRHTLQIGEPSIIAERCGITVVADFRPRDIAAGGQGAPLVPAFDEWMFGASPRVVALQNIGGMANVTVVGRPACSLAFDTGPGNALIDEAVRTVSRGALAFDRDGAMAARGRLVPDLLDRLLDLPWLLKRPPKSTGRERFGPEFLRRCAGRLLSRRPEDTVATLTYFTARTIADSYARFIRPAPGEVIVSGGGALNRTLMRHLEWLLFPAPVRSSTLYGIDPMAKEAAAFAWLAVQVLRNRTNTSPWATGARHAVVAGKIIPGGAR